MQADGTPLDLSRGFLPSQDPLGFLPSKFEIWEDTGRNLPKLLVAQKVLEIFKSMPVLATDSLTSEQELERAMLLLSFFGHAYVWGGETQHKIPKAIAVPWVAVATKLRRMPVLSYASYALHNWRRIDPAKPIELGNIVLLQNFLGGIDEEWFVLVHVDIEMKAAGALQRFKPLQEAVANKDIVNVCGHLKEIVSALEKMCTTLDRMTEHCDPYIYYNRVRPYIHGWKDNPALPHGLIYEGVTAYQDTPQQLRGETGAQSSIVPSFDALLGVVHKEDPLRLYLNEMRDYMPLQHRQFLEQIEQKGNIRQFILDFYHQESSLRDLYNDCLNLLSRFRQTHLKFAAQYIQKQSQTSSANPTEIGTGGTPFMNYLRKHKDETLSFLVD